MSGILGSKLGMTRLIQDDGRVIPMTIVKCDPNTITQVKTVEKEGYPAIVLGFSELKKPTKTKKFKHVKEFKISSEEAKNYKKGDKITIEKIAGVEIVKVTAVSKGKGFQGVVKRFHAKGGPASHGSHFHREPGSIGCRAKPGRVEKGRGLPGRMGTETVTTLKKLVYVDQEKNLIGLNGGIAGPNGGLVIIRTIK